MCEYIIYVCAYHDVNVPANKVGEHMDDVLLRSGFLEVSLTRTVTFLKREKRNETVTEN